MQRLFDHAPESVMRPIQWCVGIMYYQFLGGLTLYNFSIGGLKPPKLVYIYIGLIASMNM